MKFVLPFRYANRSAFLFAACRHQRNFFGDRSFPPVGDAMVGGYSEQEKGIQGIRNSGRALLCCLLGVILF